VTNLLLEKRGHQVEITDHLVCLIAEKFKEQTMRLLLEKQGEKIKINEEVVIAAVGNKQREREGKE
jgi:hypothetical protein